MRIEIGGRLVGHGCPMFVIAELGLNHGGSLETALALVDAAADAGASAVKLQTIQADRLVAADCPPPAHVAVESLRGFFRQFELDERAHRAVAERAHARGLAMMSTPFSEEAVDMLQAVGCHALKIASGAITRPSSPTMTGPGITLTKAAPRDSTSVDVDLSAAETLEDVFVSLARG